MDFYSFIVENKEIFKSLYAALLIVICISIVIKANRLFQISSHQGIRYFRNAFLFFGLAFAFRYFFQFPITGELSVYNFLGEVFFEFFIVMAGFFLLYSLMWRKLELQEGYRSSLFNQRILIFYSISLIIVILDVLWGGFNFMFLSQIVLFLFLSGISFHNYNKDGRRNQFPKFYFLAMVLGFMAWALNAIVVLYFDWNKFLIVGSYIFNMAFFLLFLYGVVKATKSNS